MSVVTLKAHFDGKQIQLDEPYEIPPDAKVTVTGYSGEEESLDEWRSAWFALSHKGLARAYGDDEPNYSDYIGKPPPPE